MKVVLVANFDRCLFLLQNMHHYFKKSIIACVYYFDVGLIVDYPKRQDMTRQRHTTYNKKHDICLDINKTFILQHTTLSF